MILLFDGKSKVMKFRSLSHNLIDVFKKKFFKNKNEKSDFIQQHLQSDKLQKKLALLIKDIEVVDQKDLKHVQYKKMDRGTKHDLLVFYRLDFHSRDELDSFKKKYRSLIL